MRYYGIEWTYGRAVDERGERIGTYYQFVDRRERDEWAFHPRRDKIRASDSELRRILADLRRWNRIVEM